MQRTHPLPRGGTDLMGHVRQNDPLNRFQRFLVILLRNKNRSKRFLVNFGSLVTGTTTPVGLPRWGPRAKAAVLMRSLRVSPGLWSLSAEPQPLS